MNEQTHKTTRNILLIAAGGALLVFLCASMAVAGFVVGQRTAQARTTTETVTEVVTRTVTEISEVTREVTVVVTPETAVVAEPTPLPTPLPTAEPAPLPTAAPTAVPTPAETAEFEPRALDFQIFYDVWEIVEGQYDGELPAQNDLLYAAISGSLEALDDKNTRFIRPELAARIRQDMTGSVSGIGAIVRSNEQGQFEIVRPIDGQPAAFAGLRPGDVIIAVDGQSVLDISFDEVILKVRGPEGTTVTLTVSRLDEPEPLEFTIVRTTFSVPITQAEMLGDAENPIAYVRLTSFNGNALEALRAELEQLLAQNPVGLILDLRDNPGGFLDQSVAVADLFLPASVVLYERNIRGLDETFRAVDGDLAEQIPLVVLVNAGSASASEIVAGAIQDNGRGVVIGETTFGKGSVQQVFQLADGSELRVTFARWYTPNNNTIDGAGITPDIEVESPLELGGENDTQLQRAIQYFLGSE